MIQQQRPGQPNSSKSRLTPTAAHCSFLLCIMTHSGADAAVRVAGPASAIEFHASLLEDWTKALLYENAGVGVLFLPPNLLPEPKWRGKGRSQRTSPLCRPHG
jgi:hypothetical protein